MFQSNLIINNIYDETDLNKFPLPTVVKAQARSRQS